MIAEGKFNCICTHLLSRSTRSRPAFKGVRSIFSFFFFLSFSALREMEIFYTIHKYAYRYCTFLYKSTGCMHCLPCHFSMEHNSCIDTIHYICSKTLNANNVDIFLSDIYHFCA